MSSATIPDDLTMSTTSVFDKLTNSLDGEKEALLRRLRELMLTEENQVDKNLNDCKARLSMMESEYLTAINQLKEEVMKEEEALMQKQLDEVNSLKKSQRAEEERIEMEIRKLEAEFESILAPSKMVASLRDSSSQSDHIPRGVNTNTNAELSELELELQCSGCMKVCCPPSMIFQCPEGDLLCQDCRDTVDVCPACNIALCAGLLSRNKVLENIARKYFKCM